MWRTSGGRIVRMHCHGADIPYSVLHLLPVPNQFAGKTFLCAGRETVLRGGLFEYVGKVFGLHDADSGAHSQSHWQTLSSWLFLLCGLQKESRRRAVYRGRHQPESLH